MLRFVRFGGFGGAGARVDKGDIAAGLDVAAEARVMTV